MTSTLKCGIPEITDTGEGMVQLKEKQAKLKGGEPSKGVRGLKEMGRRPDRRIGGIELW